MENLKEEKKKNCPLCELKIITRLYYEDPMFVIIDCATCKVPMVVFRPHREPTKEEQEKMVTKAKELFPDRVPDFRRRSIPDHWHMHMR